VAGAAALVTRSISVSVARSSGELASSRSKKRWIGAASSCCNRIASAIWSRRLLGSAFVFERPSACTTQASTGTPSEALPASAPVRASRSATRPSASQSAKPPS
jgi:hypothetical protein